MKTRLFRLTAKSRRAAVHGRRWVERFLNYIVFMLAMGVAVVVTIYVFEGSGQPSAAGARSVLVRNVGLVIGGAFAFWVAVWRSRVADRQADTAQRGLLNQRYQEGAEMLGSALLSVRLAGIYSLRRLAEEHAMEYHIQIMRLFCAFMRHPVGDDEADTSANREHESSFSLGLREDSQAIINAVCSRSDRQIAFEDGDSSFRFDMRGVSLEKGIIENAKLSNALFANADLSGAFLNGADLSGAALHAAVLNGAKLLNARLNDARFYEAALKDAILAGTEMKRAVFYGADLRCAHLTSADLSNATLDLAKLYGAVLDDANLTRARLRWVEGLTQAQIDQARADPENPPKLDGVVDAETGQPLVWRGKPIEDTA